MKTPNAWRVWDAHMGRPMYLIADFNEETGLYTRRLLDRERRLLGVAAVSGYISELREYMVFSRQSAWQQAQRRGYDHIHIGDAVLTKDDVEAGLRQTKRGGKVVA